MLRNDSTLENNQVDFSLIPVEVISTVLLPELDIKDLCHFAQSSNQMNTLVKSIETSRDVKLSNGTSLKGSYSEIITSLQLAAKQKEERLSQLENSVSHQYKKLLGNTVLNDYDGVVHGICCEEIPGRTPDTFGFVDTVGMWVADIIAIASFPAIAVPVATVLGGLYAGVIAVVSGTGICIAGNVLSGYCGKKIWETEKEIKQISDELGRNRPVLIEMRK